MPKGFLIAQRGHEIGTRYRLRHGQTSLGRNPDNMIVVDELAVSRYHAMVIFNELTGDINIRDLGSTNGVTVNNLELNPNMPYRLRQRDTIFIGRGVFSLQIRPDDYVPALPPAYDDPHKTGRLNLPSNYRHNTKKLVEFR